MLRIDICYGTALDDAERPLITWANIYARIGIVASCCSTREAYLRWENRGFPARHETLQRPEEFSQDRGLTEEGVE